MRKSGFLLQNLIRKRAFPPPPSLASIDKALIQSSPSPSSSPSFSGVPEKQMGSATSAISRGYFQLSNPLLHTHSFCSSSGSSNIVVINSEKDFNDALCKVQDDSLPAIFYFTAVWCGPCRFIAPIIQQLSEKFPHVTTYKVDIDMEGLGSTLQKLNIMSVPTFHFFKGGKKESEVVGADVEGLKRTMEKYYQ